MGNDEKIYILLFISVDFINVSLYGNIDLFIAQNNNWLIKEYQR